MKKTKSATKPIAELPKSTVDQVAPVAIVREPPGTKGKTYNLPNFFALALGSGRGELVSLASRPVKDGTLVLDVETQCELIRLVGDLISDASASDSKVREMASLVSDLMDAHDELKEPRHKYNEILYDLKAMAEGEAC